MVLGLDNLHHYHRRCAPSLVHQDHVWAIAARGLERAESETVKAEGSEDCTVDSSLYDHQCRPS